jgi:hypothetical protein
VPSFLPSAGPPIRAGMRQSRPCSSANLSSPGGSGTAAYLLLGATTSPSHTHTTPVARKLTRTVHSWATQTPPELVKVQPRNTATPAKSQATQAWASASGSASTRLSGRRAKAAVSHSKTKMSANGFQVCVTNSAPSSHGNAARKYRWGGSPGRYSM